MISNQIRESLQLVCSALNEHHVDYIIIGGIAVGFFGYQRISGASIANPSLKADLDFWYRPTTDNFINLIKALEKIGVDKGKLDEIIFNPKKTFLKIPHAKFNTDFLPSMLGLNSYTECKARAEKHLFDGIELYILSYQDLIKNKQAVNRETDRNDIGQLNKKIKN